MKKIMMIEFNELCPQLLDKWMASGDLPNFRHLHSKSSVFTTVADETEPVCLEPWIQWYSIHTGLPFSQHKVFHLSDGPRAGHPDIWSILHDAGKSVWNCSSMNAKHFAHSGSAYLPDPWCTSEASHPPELEIFHRFVGHQVREYSNSDQRLSAIDNVKFLLFMARNGLSSNTISAVLKQYFSEYKSKGKTRWQRVALLDRFLFDVFRYYFKHLNPDFSTFFCNSTAHLQHSYWRHMEPDKYTVKPSREELDQYSNAIKFGYQRMDLLLGEIMSLAGENTQIIFSTALSQQPYLKYEHIGGHNFYRPRNINDLLGRIGVNPVNVQPVMTHQFLAKFENDDIAQKSKEVLSALMIGDMQIFGFDDGMPGSIYFGSQIRTVMASDVLIKSSIDSTFSEKFSELFYKIDGLKSGRHHPEGCLWIQTGEHAKSLDKVSILDILPTIAKQLDVVIAGYPGRSLI